MALLCTAVLAACTSTFAYLMGPLLDALLRGQSPKPEGMLGKALQVLHPQPLSGEALLELLPLLLVGLAAVKAASQFGQGYLLGTAAARLTARLRRALYEKLLTLPPAFFQDKHSGELFTRFSADVAQVELAVTQGLLSYVRDSLTASALLLMCALVDAKLLMVLVAAVPLAAWPIARFAKGLKGIARRSQGALGKTTERVSEVLSAMRVVQAYRQESAEVSRFDMAQSAYLAEMRRSFFWRAAFTPVLEMLGVLGLALSVFFAAEAIAQGTLASEHLFTFLVSAMLLYQPIKSLSSTGQLIVGATASAERLLEVLDAPGRPDAPGATPLPLLERSVRFEGVRFSYGETEVLRGLDLEIRAGEKVALVGPSGAGKSTVIALLLGFWRAGHGRITVDGHDLAGATLASWRAQMALVTQEPVLFAGTVAENLRCGKEGASEAELRAAAEAAGALGFIEALPGGFDSAVGERGCLLSGGQRQRIALARALLRDARLLVLDEATSSLDAESERGIEEGLSRLLKGRAALIVAHRLSTVRRADRIVVLERGVVVEEGTHEQLVARGGLYARLWSSFVGAESNEHVTGGHSARTA
jgi:subfamily B ATP-binding cassette protein MsbA